MKKIKKTSDNLSASVVASQQDLDVVEILKNLNNTPAKETFDEITARRITRNTTTKTF